MYNTHVTVLEKTKEIFKGVPPPRLLNILMYLQNFTNSENPAACSTEDCMTSAFQTVDHLQYPCINEKLVFRPLPDIPQALCSKLEVK